jgi:cytochrome c553
MKKLIIALALGAVSFTAASSTFAADVKRGEELTRKYNCASCHGADFSKPIDPSYPKLAGQHADYIAHALSAYKRGGDKANGRNNPIMGGFAKPLSDQDMADIAAYLSGLPSQLVVSK